MDEPASARIVARLPLLEAGLRRLALGARVRIVESEQVSLVLRSPDQPPDGSALDVTVLGDTVVVTCRTAPSSDEWDAIRRVIVGALGG